MLADDFNEDAARFLGRPVPSSLGTIEARIRGIQSVELIDDWLECEIAVGPRQSVLAALNQRKAQLEAPDADADPREVTAES